MSEDFLIGYGVTATVLWSLVLVGAVRDAKRYQDDRSGFAVLMALVLTVISLGFALSRAQTTSDLTTFVLHVARGSVVVGALAILAVRLQKRWKRRKR